MLTGQCEAGGLPQRFSTHHCLAARAAQRLTARTWMFGREPKVDLSVTSRVASVPSVHPDAIGHHSKVSLRDSARPSRASI